MSKHQINIHGLNNEHLIIASSYGTGCNKKLVARFDLVRQIMKFDVDARDSDKGKVCDTIEEAVAVYNEI